MNALELIKELQSKNIIIYRHGYRLRWNAPKGSVPSDEINEAVKEHWDEIIKRVDGPIPYWVPKGKGAVKITKDDCLKTLDLLPGNLIDLIVTDPPYGLNILGNDWDNIVPPISIWKECLRVLKPGGFAYIMSSTRQDVLARMIFNLQEAGFDTRNSSLYWTYKQGFPIRDDISKAIKRKIDNIKKKMDEGGDQAYFDLELLAAEVKASEGAYPGYNPKPAVEVIIIAQKPGDKKTSVEQFLSNKKGSSWLEDCRHPYADELDAEQVKKNFTGGKYNVGTTWSKTKKLGNNFNEEGRFPANLLVSDDALGQEDSKYFSLDSWLKKKQLGGLNIDALEKAVQKTVPFLIVPKPSPKEKNFGCEDIISEQKDKKGRNYHPTVKPILLMNYLITMGSREGELVLDPFCGSGTTCLAARLLKRPSIGIEKDPGYYKIAAAKIRALTLATWGEETKKDNQPNKMKKASKATTPSKKTKKVIIYHDKPGIALTPQKKIDSHNFPFTLNTGIGCHFGCRYCYLQGSPFRFHTKFPSEAKVKLWMADRLDKELTKYKHLPQHLKRVQVNVATEGYLPLVMTKVKKELNRDIMAEVLQMFRRHWENGNHWMVHLITKSHMVLKHLDIISAMRDQVQLEMTITTLDEDRRRRMEGLAPSVTKRLKVMEKFASAGVFVRAMCMPLIGDRQDAEVIRAACFENGAQAFKHKGVNYWGEDALLAGETKRESGRQDEVFEDLLVKSCEPYRENGDILKMSVKMPVIIKSGKSKRWKGYQETDLQDREMIMEVSGYSEINDIDWGYVK